MEKQLVSIFGYGKVGSAVAKRLKELGYEIDIFTISRSENTRDNMVYLRPEVYIENIISNGLNLDFIVVCTPGDILEKYLYNLLITRVPIIILSTSYDEDSVKSKCLELDVTSLMSQNMALPILEMWDIIRNSQKISFGEKIEIISVSESHPGFKKDISGTLLKTISAFESLGIENNLDFDYIIKNYKPYEDLCTDGINIIRNQDTQLREYDFLTKEYLDAHAYHQYILKGDNSDVSKSFLEYLYSRLVLLKRYSNENLLIDIKISDSGNILIINHNINGRSIYGDGVDKSIKFLSKNKGVFTGIDIIKEGEK